MGYKLQETHIKSLPDTLPQACDGDLAAAGLLGSCKLPTMNCVGYLQDEWIANLPVWLGVIPCGAEQPVIIGQDHIYTEVEEDCEVGTIDTQINACSWLVPEAADFEYNATRMKFKDLWKKFCNLNPKMRGCPYPFNDDGVLDGSSASVTFAKYISQAFNEGYFNKLAEVAATGDAAMPNQFGGIFPQLDNGWDYPSTSAQTCDIYNKASVLDWAAATAAAVDCDGNPIAGSLGATTDAGFDPAFWGNPSPLGGMSLAHVLAAWIDAVDPYAMAHGGVDQWELIVPRGWRKCIAEAIACIRMCCTQPDVDLSDVQARYVRVTRQSIIDLEHLSEARIVIQETTKLTDCMYFIPREVGGCQTYGIVAEPVGAALQAIGNAYNLPLSSGSFDDNFFGGNADDNPLIAQTAPALAANFGSAAIGRRFRLEGDKCVHIGLSMCATGLAMHRCMTLKICGAMCSSFTKPVNTPCEGEKAAEAPKAEAKA